MANEIGYFEAILAIDATAEVAINNNDYDSIQWFDTSVIAKSVLDSKVTELQTAYDELAYARSRQKIYPSWQEQMDMQYHDNINSTTTWNDAIKTVKDKFPK